MFDRFIVGFDGLVEIVGTIFVCEVGDNRDRSVGLHLGRNLGYIDHDLRMEDLLLDAFVKVIGDGAGKHALRQVANLRRRDQAVHLRVDRGGNVLPIDGDG